MSPPAQQADDTGSLVYKILQAEEWETARSSGRYDGSAADVRDGYIHLSARHQLASTAAKHFRGRTGLILVALEASALGPALKWEASRGGDLFPHLYAPLDPGLALWTRPLDLGKEGVPMIPADAF